MKLIRIVLLCLLWAPASYAVCPTPLTIKDASGTTQNISTTDDASGNCQGNTVTTPGARTLVTLDIKTVTTGAVPVVALSAGHKTAGGLIQNPPTASINLCINEIGTASGTTSSGDTTCIIPGQSYSLTASSGAVSVISSDSAHAFSGYGLQ